MKMKTQMKTTSSNSTEQVTISISPTAVLISEAMPHTGHGNETYGETDVTEARTSTTLYRHSFSDCSVKSITTKTKWTVASMNSIMRISIIRGLEWTQPCGRILPPALLCNSSTDSSQISGTWFKKEIDGACMIIAYHSR
jgi:hypothetical protein